MTNKPKNKNEGNAQKMVWELPNGTPCRFVPLNELFELFNYDIVPKSSYKSQTTTAHFQKFGITSALFFVVMLAFFEIPMVIIFLLTLGFFAVFSRRMVYGGSKALLDDFSPTVIDGMFGILSMIPAFFIYIFPLHFVLTVGAIDGIVMAVTWILSAMTIRHVTEPDMVFRNLARDYCLETFVYLTYETQSQFEQRMQDKGASLRPETDDDFSEHKTKFMSHQFAQTITDAIFKDINNDDDLRQARLKARFASRNRKQSSIKDNM